MNILQRNNILFLIKPFLNKTLFGFLKLSEHTYSNFYETSILFCKMFYLRIFTIIEQH